MKKTKIIFFIMLIFIYLATLIFTIVPALFASQVNMNYVYAKNILLFIVIGIITYSILNKVTNHTITKWNLLGTKENIALGLKVFLFAGILALTSILQLDYIGYSETPYDTRCLYYDNYNNLIYSSYNPAICPEIDFIEETDSTLSFEIIKSLEGTADGFQFDENDTEYYNVTMYDLTVINTVITYDSNHRIIEVSKNVSSVSEIYGETESRIKYYSYAENVVNTYEDGFRQVNKTASYSEGLSSVPTSVIHHVFSEEDYSVTTYYSEEISEGTAFVLYKEYYDGDDLVTEVQTSISYLDFINGVSYIVEVSNGNLSDDYTMNNETRFYDDSVEEYYTSSNESESFTSNVFTTYTSRSGYEDLKFSAESRIEYSGVVRESSTLYKFQTIAGKDYVVRSSAIGASPNVISFDNTIFALEPMEYGFVVKQLQFADEEYIKHILEKDTSFPFSFVAPYGSNETSSIFDVGYSFNYSYLDDIIYLKPAYMCLD